MKNSLSKKVLMVSYHWPPSGGVTVLRTLKLAKYLRCHGWEPIIFTADRAQYQVLDDSLLDQASPEIHVIRCPIWEPYALYKKLTRQSHKISAQDILTVKSRNLGVLHKWALWCRANFFVPDARAFWIKPSIRFLNDYLQKHPVDAIFSAGPPHTNTVIACKISQITKIPWLADFQDPWTQIDYHQFLPMTGSTKRKHRRLEKEAFGTAAKITTVGETWAKDLTRLGAHNVTVIPLGYDEDDFSNVIPISSEQHFIISHIGQMGWDRCPHLFFDVLESFQKSDRWIHNNLRLKLIGQVDFRIRQRIEKGPLRGITEFTGQLPRQKAMAHLMGSHLVLLLMNQTGDKGRIPAKVFEYLRSSKPILGLGYPDGETARLIRSYAPDSSWISSYDNAKHIGNALKEALAKLKLRLPTKQNPCLSESFSLSKLSERVAGLLDQIRDN